MAAHARTEPRRILQRQINAVARDGVDLNALAGVRNKGFMNTVG